MKLLFLANRIPFPPYRGDKLKIYNLAKRLCKHHELHLLTFTETEEDKAYGDALREIFTTVHLVHRPKWLSALSCLQALWNPEPVQVLYFRSAAMRRKLEGLLAQHHFDGIHVQHLRMAPYLDRPVDARRILDLPDAFSLYWERRKQIKRGWIRAAFENMEQKRLLRFEGKMLRAYPLSLVCSQEDMDYLRTTHKVQHVALLPNGVDLETFNASLHDYTHRHTMLFTGNMDYAPNVDAVVYFVEEILPLIRARFPDVRFVIAGQRPVEKVTALASESVVVTGFVKDLAAVYADASVVVAPLRFGAGTQNKVLEAMAMGVPVVCSHIGFGGLGIESGEGAIMQTDKQAFAASVISLLASEELRRTVGEKGREVVRTRFDWNVIARRLEGYFGVVE